MGKVWKGWKDVSMRFVMVALILCSFWGCTKEVRNDAPELQRLVREELSRTSEGLSEAPVLDASWKATGARSAENSPTGLRLLWGGTPASLTLDGQIRAKDYASFVIRMRVSPVMRAEDMVKSARAFFRWQGPLDPLARPETEISVQIFPDNVLHTYRIPLWSSEGTTWVGEINRIEFMPCDLAADIEIASMELVHEPSSTPMRLTFGSETHEALFGTQDPWRVTVPPNAMFETYVGMEEISWLRDTADGVEFRVHVEDANGGVVELARDLFDPLHREEDRVWRLLQADLSAYAGQTVMLHLTVDQRAKPLGDYAYWGGPTIFQRGGAENATPVILISCDTLRADHLSCYGYSRETTPNLDEFRKDAVLFENAMCPVAWTLQSHATMLTGLHPKNHSVSHSVHLPEEIETLAERLSDAGYLTAAYTGVSGYLSTIYGFSHGFDVYNTPPVFRIIEDTLRLTLNWLDRHDRDQFFLFMHNFDIHAKSSDFSSVGPAALKKLPYYPPHMEDLLFAKDLPVPASLQFKNPEIPIGARFLEIGTHEKYKFNEETIEYLIALYDDGIRYVDKELAKLFDSLRERDLYDKALIIVTSDHGEEFGEHGSYAHSQIYQECHHVPLLIKFPHGEHAGETVSPVVQLTDLYPTIHEVLGIETPEGGDGQSLVGLVKGTTIPFDKAYGYIMGQRALRTGNWHLIVGAKGQTDLFDVSVDPQETQEVSTDYPSKVEEFREDLDGYFAVATQGWNISFTSAASHGSSRFEVSAVFEKPLASVKIDQAEDHPQRNLDTFSLSDDNLSVRASLMLWTLDRDRLVMRTTEGGQRLQLRVVASRPVDIVIGNEAAVRTNAHEVLLDPDETEYPKPEVASMGAGEVPRVAIWYERPTIDLPATQALTDEEKAELEAMGYIQ